MSYTFEVEVSKADRAVMVFTREIRAEIVDMVAQRTKQPGLFDNDIWEIKHDGYRVIAGMGFNETKLGWVQEWASEETSS